MTEETRETLEGRIDMAKRELDEHIEYNEYTGEELREFLDEPHDAIHEIADGCVPVYTGDLLEVACSDINLACNEPELGPAYDGSPTPVNIIAANVYEAISEALFEYAVELLGALEEQED